jgi:hypothetical protein
MYGVWFLKTAFKNLPFHEASRIFVIFVLSPKDKPRNCF